MSQEAKRSYLPQLDIVRAIGIMAVIMIHATSSIVVNYDHNAAIYPLYVFLNIFPKFVVPIFIFLSGFVLFYNYIDKPFTLKTLGTFYKKRISKILIPFFFFSFFFWAIRRYSAYGFTDISTFIGYFHSWRFLQLLLIGKTYAHLYFIVIIIQFYAIAPFMLMALKRFPRLGKHMVWMGLLVQWGFVFIVAKEFDLINRSTYSFSYMFYFVAGAYIGMYYMKLVEWIKVSKQNASPKKVIVWVSIWLLFAVTSLIEVYFYYNKHMTGAYLFSLHILELIYEVLCISAAIIILQLSYWIYDKWNSTIVKALSHIGATSFGIYLLHPLVLFLYRQNEVSGNPIVYFAWAAGGFLAALLLSWLLVSITAKFKWHWLLFGPLPVKK